MESETVLSASSNDALLKWRRTSCDDCCFSAQSLFSDGIKHSLDVGKTDLHFVEHHVLLFLRHNMGVRIIETASGSGLIENEMIARVSCQEGQVSGEGDQHVTTRDDKDQVDVVRSWMSCAASTAARGVLGHEIKTLCVAYHGSDATASSCEDDRGI